jgi:two-component system OmpR family sensor kinase/two-component system sensor histidine kinase BaeS
MRSLSVKLIGAFAVVILLGAAITYVVAGQTLSSQYRLYVNQRGQLRAASWAPLFADYYARTGGWVGVETLLNELPIGVAAPGMMGRGQGGPRQGQGQSGAAPGLGGGYGMGAGAEDRLILADAGGQVVLDSEGEMLGQALTAADLVRGAPVEVEGQRVGALLVVAPESGPAAALADDLLAALNRSVLLAALAAGLLALLLGALLVRQIIAPMRRLQTAARAIAGGDMSQRVRVTSHDEVGEVGHAFNHMAAALERDERLRRHMMADIAHELRTPLTVIQGQVEALLDGVFPLTPEQLSPIHAETLLLTRLVADLRELALAEAGQLSVERKPVELGDLARRVATAVEPAAVEKGIALSLDIAPDLPPVSADPDRLNQVLHNLLSNALRHTPVGGKIAVSVGPSPGAEQMSLYLARGGAQGQRSRGEIPSPPRSPAPPLLVAVADSGPGIPAEDLPYIFDRFYRADKSRSRAGGGSGLGLTIARYIVEAHGGRIWAESREGEGTRLCFTLPITIR